MLVLLLSSRGEVLTRISGPELNTAERTLSRNNRGMVVTSEGLFLLDPASPDCRFHRFSRGGQKLETKSFSIASAKGSGKFAAIQGVAAAPALDYFSSLNSGAFILTEVRLADQWQEQTVGQGQQQATARYQPFNHTLYVVSWDGMIRSIPAQNVGLLRAVGRDGFLYFVKTVTRAGKTTTEVVKASLK